MMNIESLANLLVMLGVGGAVGAMAALIVAGNKLAASLKRFGNELRAFLADHKGQESHALLQAFVELEANAAATLGAAEKLRNALKRK